MTLMTVTDFWEITQANASLIHPREDTETPLRDIEPPMDWTALFGNENPVEIEVGCGNGDFLIESSKRHPEINYIGIERSRKYVRWTKERLLKRNITTVCLVCSDAVYFVDHYVADGSVQVYHIYFPDPWPKKRHHKRRIFNNDIWLGAMIRTLHPKGGRIHLATDYEAYFYEIRQKLDAVPHLTCIPPDLIETEQIPTNFEMKYQAEGRKIYRALYQLRVLRD